MALKKDMVESGESKKVEFKNLQTWNWKTYRAKDERGWNRCETTVYSWKHILKYCLNQLRNVVHQLQGWVFDPNTHTHMNLHK